MKRVLLLLLLLISIVGLTGCTNNNGKKQDTINLDLKQLYNEINEDVDKAKKEYEGNYYYIVGNVDTIGDKNAKLFGYGNIYFQCEFKDTNAIKKFNINDRIEIKGKIKEIIKVNNKPTTIVVEKVNYVSNSLIIEGIVSIDNIGRPILNDGINEYNLTKVSKIENDKLIINDKEYNNNDQIKMEAKSSYIEGQLYINSIVSIK